jgi:ribosomal protein L12E/L44/L45/RPP1/RPP2
LSEVEANVSDDDVTRVIDSLKGKKIYELIAQGAAGLGSSASASSSSAPTKAQEVPKKEEKKKE